MLRDGERKREKGVIHAYILLTEQVSYKSSNRCAGKCCGNLLLLSSSV